MSNKDKKRFDDMAAKDKTRYDKEMANYVPAKGEAGGKRKKDPNAPKRALYVYILYTFYFLYFRFRLITFCMSDYSLLNSSTEH